MIKIPPEFNMRNHCQEILHCWVWCIFDFNWCERDSSLNFASSITYPLHYGDSTLLIVFLEIFKNEKKLKILHKLGCLPTSAKFNVFSQTL